MQRNETESRSLEPCWLKLNLAHCQWLSMFLSFSWEGKKFWKWLVQWNCYCHLKLGCLPFMIWYNVGYLELTEVLIFFTGSWILQSPEKELHLLEECSWGTEASEQEMVRAGYPLPWRRCLSPGRGSCASWLALTFLSVQLCCFLSPSLVSHDGSRSCS